MDEITDRLGELFESIVDQISKITFDKNHPQQLYTVCLYGSILESSLACLKVLKDERTHAAIPVLARNIFEAYVDLVNLVRYPEYIHIMNAIYLREKKRLFNATITNGHKNPFLGQPVNYGDLEADYDKIKKELDDLKSRGIKPISIKDKFDRAELEAQYVSVYPLMCNHSHNNLSVLEKRHIKQSNGDHEVHYFQRWKKKDLLHYLNHISRILYDSTLMIGKLLNITDKLDIKKIEAALCGLDKAMGLNNNC